MPKEVDHEQRRRELADAACRVIACEGLTGGTLTLVAAEAGWSIGSIRHYFPTKNDLLVAALWHIGERIDERIRRRTAGGMRLADLRTAGTELLPLDTERRQESLVWLAFVAQAAIDPTLASMAEQIARDLRGPFVTRIREAVRAGELPAHLDAELEATHLQVLFDGLVVGLVTAPRQLSGRRALAVFDDHLASLAATKPSSASRPRPPSPKANR